MSAGTKPVYAFGDFRLDTAERVLLRDGKPVSLTPKAFEVLMLLVKSSGQIVGKDELINQVWADSFVEEGNLKVTVSMLRKVLEEGAGEHQFIETVPRRGYRFVAEVRELSELSDQREDLILFERIRAAVLIEEEEERAEQEQEKLSRSARIAPGAGSVRLVYPAGGLIVALLVAGGAVWFSRNRAKESLSSPSRQEMTLRRFTAHGGVPFRFAISPDGKTLVYWQRIKNDYSLWLGQIETNSSVPLNEQPDLMFDNLVFTRDGSTIYFNVSGGNRPRPMLARMAILGEVITELIPQVHSDVTFSPDGRQMAFLRRQDAETRQTSLIIADASDGQNQLTLTSRRQPESFSSEALSWSPDGKSIAFSAYSAEGQQQIMSVSVGDGNVTRIGNRTWSYVDNVQWLPDGSGAVAMASESVADRRRQIWLVPYPEGEARPVASNLTQILQRYLSVSSAGKIAVLQGSVNSEIWIAPHGDATQARRVFQGVAPRYEGVDGLAWMPDGGLLYTAYVGESQVVWSMDSDGSNLKQLTPNRTGASDSDISVSPDGRQLVFQSNRSGTFEIWRMNSDGSDLKQLTSGGNNTQPSLTPDAQWVVYTSVRDGKVTLSRIPTDGGEPTWIADMSSSWTQVSPDGHYIACVVSSPRQLLIIPFTGGAPVKSFPVPATALRGRLRPRWMPDGKAIIYKNNPQGLWLQALTEERPQLVKGFEESPVHNLVWSFDGKNLAYSTGPTTQEIILIENFK
jgi:Tol biopolymer transport system component/DNA-binding winged helix-turn-helix (wHTH) protein